MKRLAQLAAALMVGFGLIASSSTAGAQQRTDCSDFTYQEDAQAVLERDRSDPHNLDGDNDGIACEDLARRSATGAQTPSPTTTGAPVATSPTSAPPTAAPSTTTPPLAATGIEEDAYLVGAGLVLGGLMLVAISRWVHPSPASPWDILGR